MTTDTASPPLPTTTRIELAEARIATNRATIARLEKEIAQSVADSGDIAPELRASIVRLEQEIVDIGGGLAILRERLAAEQAAAADARAAVEQERQRARARVRVAAADRVDAAMSELGAAFANWRAQSRDSPRQLHNRLPFTLRAALHVHCGDLARALELPRPQGSFRETTFAHGEKVLAPAGTFATEEQPR